MPPLNRPNQRPAFDDDEKSECLADSLELQCTPSTLPADPVHLAKVDTEVERRAALPPPPPAAVTEDDDPLYPVTADEVESLIKNLHPRKAPGSDGISNLAVKCFPASLVLLLVSIFNAAMSQNLFPQAWKEAIVIGIPKPGKPKAEPTSYRPISLLRTMGKLYERIIYARLKSFANSHKLLPDEQFGFRAKHSCVHQVHRIVEHITCGFHKKMHTGVLFFDVAKAFDKVWHNGLLYKLYHLGVPDRLVLIIRDFLSCRSFRYRIEGALSSPHPIRAGVPQGSVLSPLLFALYTSDIPKVRKAHLALFADDTAIYCSFKSLTNIHKVLQSSADALGAWFTKWRIEVNPEKSTAVLFTFKKSTPNPKVVKLFKKPIPWEEQAKYLGVTLDRRLTFWPHAKIVRTRAARAMGMLHCLLNAHSKMSIRNKIRIYTACIRPIVTYASVVFAHAVPSVINHLQVLQNKFLRTITGVPWFTRNRNLHADIQLPTIKQFIKDASERYFKSAASHPNPLIKAASTYKPLLNKKRRRPKCVLNDSDDPITAYVSAVLEIENQSNIVQPPIYRPRRRGSRRVSSRRFTRSRPGPDQNSQVLTPVPIEPPQQQPEPIYLFIYVFYISRLRAICAHRKSP